MFRLVKMSTVLSRRAQALCEDVTKADIDAVIQDLLQLYDLEAKCVWGKVRSGGRCSITLARGCGEPVQYQFRPATRGRHFPPSSVEPGAWWPPWWTLVTFDCVSWSCSADRGGGGGASRSSGSDDRDFEGPVVTGSGCRYFWYLNCFLGAETVFLYWYKM